ncbi:MAG TPA: UDP-N-acetylmuramoyl-L-alanine--D-glutamate ligase, partial [Ilumatobacter sp.]|nr:UDP-N-acetylmuramoyl-L-alanine--D-glutamate ligase [Ilumatobacter sp.]
MSTPRALVHGLAVTGIATARALLARGYQVVATDDRIDDATRDAAATLGLELGSLPSDLDAFVRTFDLVSPAPGVPETHRLVVAATAAGVDLVSEIELAYRWEQQRSAGPRPILAITGTDGKTTTTEMTVAILRAAGHRTEALGNTDVPLLDALDGDGLHGDLDVFVVECTSFRLAWTEQFRADAAVWLNLAPDHLNWHVSMDSYAAAKERIFSLQTADDVAIGFVDDPAVMAALDRAPGRQRTFGLAGADYHLTGTTLTGPSGPIVDTSRMKRRLPHDVTNALAASALVLETGLADIEAIGAALESFDAPPHRLEPVGSAGGIEWFNDSKATTPHAAST